MFVVACCKIDRLANKMTVPVWYIRERCPEFAYLSPRSQQNWLLLLQAEFRSTRELTAKEYTPTGQTMPRTDKHKARSSAQQTDTPVGSRAMTVTDASVQGEPGVQPAP